MSSAALIAVPRQVRTIYAVRTVSFVWCFLVVALHAWERSFGPAVYAAAVLHFLAFPHLAWLRASRARDPRGNPAPVRRRLPARRWITVWNSGVDRLPDGVRAGAPQHHQPRPPGLALVLGACGGLLWA
jgi:hypothetical protein